MRFSHAFIFNFVKRKNVFLASYYSPFKSRTKNLRPRDKTPVLLYIFDVFTLT